MLIIFSIPCTMKTSIRFNFQVILWVGIWLLLWVSERGESGFIKENGLTFFFQICLIGGIIYYAVPQLLFKKQQFTFSLLIIVVIFIFAFLCSNFDSPPQPLQSHTQQLIKKRRNSPPKPIVINFLFLSIASLTAIFIETNIFAQKKEQEAILNKNEMLQTELKLLRFQINPHFLFNTLNNIYTLSVIDSDKTQQSISNLSTMLRYVLYDCEKSYVSIQQEITYIENYIKLFSLKSIDPYPITVEKNINNLSSQIAPMLLIPFVENALKHSYIEKKGDSFIHIKIMVDGTIIHFEIQNSKPNHPISKDNIGGIGLENVKKRLKILYPQKHLLAIKENDSTFNVKLIINGNETD